jgi:hypothetical protein
MEAMREHFINFFPLQWHVMVPLVQAHLFNEQQNGVLLTKKEQQ